MSIATENGQKQFYYQTRLTTFKSSSDYQYTGAKSSRKHPVNGGDGEDCGNVGGEDNGDG